jgi:hypothetical protein
MSGRPKDPVWEHGDNLAPGWRCNYCGMQKSGGGSTRFKQHLAARGSSVLHCSRVPPPVREYFQRDIERAKKTTTERDLSFLPLNLCCMTCMIPQLFVFELFVFNYQLTYACLILLCLV